MGLLLLVPGSGGCSAVAAVVAAVAVAVGLAAAVAVVEAPAVGCPGEFVLERSAVAGRLLEVERSPSWQL